MLLREKGKKDGDPIGMGWDEAQAALLAGTHDVAEGSDKEDEKKPDPAPTPPTPPAPVSKVVKP